MSRALTRSLRLAFAVTAIGWMAAQTSSGQEQNRRQPNRNHYARLAGLSGAAAGTELDGQRFPLDKWGDLYAWRLLRPHYVTIPVSAFTPVTAPANGSPQTRAELDYLLALQASRTPEEQAWCDELAGVYYHPLIVNPADRRYTANRDNLFVVGRSLGPWFTQRTLPQTADLLARVHHDAMIHMVELKLAYARPRPHHLEPRIQAADAKIPHGSFPSGHSFISNVNAEVLARLAPAKRDVLLQSALEMAWSRELLGVHYPSDSEAGRIFAGDFVRFLFENEEFRRNFDSVRQEWARAASGS